MKAVKVGIVLLLVLVTAGVATATESVSEQKARELANYQLHYLVKLSESLENYPFEVWKGAKIGSVEKRYTFNGILTAYDFKVVKNGKVVGQILVNARKTGNPIVEYSLNERVSFGKTEYLPLFEASEKYLREHGIKGSTVSEKRRNLWETGTASLEKAEENGGNSILSSITEYAVLPVEHIAWDDGCSPTSAAMILEYHGEHGYPNLDFRDEYYVEPTDVDTDPFYDNPPNEHQDLTEELHMAMGTTDDGLTWPWAYEVGIEGVARDHGYNFDAINVVGPDYIRDYVWQIDAGNPVMISSEGGFPGYSGGHSVAGVGYQYSTDGLLTWDEYYIVQDPNNPYNQYWSLADVSWEMYTKVIPG